MKFLLLLLPCLLCAVLRVGIETVDVTPPVGTPSAGYRARNGAGMEGLHDPLLAIVLFLDSGDKQLALCSVDHLGFTREMVEEVKAIVHQDVECEVFVGSTHTHSGGGAFLNIPLIGFSLAGAYDAAVKKSYVEKAARAIVEASRHLVPAKLGIGYGSCDGLSVYRSTWPEGVVPSSEVAVIKITDLENAPLAVLFNFPVHPTVLDASNRQFSADFVGYARDRLHDILGAQAIYFNGAQGDVNPRIFNEGDLFDSCAQLGRTLADSVIGVWEGIETSEEMSVKTKNVNYTFKPEATPFGIQVPMDSYESEMNLIVLNGKHAFLTIPGELSCVYDQRLKEVGEKMGYTRVSILGLTNDAHGYIILPESWARKTFESRLSFGGQEYGQKTEERAVELLTRGL